MGLQVFHKSYRAKDPKTGKATGHKKIATTYTVRFRVQGRVFEKSTGCRDQSAALLEGARILRAEELRAAGVETHHEVREVPVTDLIAEYEGELRRRGCSEKHLKLTAFRIRTLAKGHDRLAKLTPERIRQALGSLDVAPTTANYYRVALNGFFAWLVREGRWSVNPVAAVGRAREVGKTLQRRALTTEELAALMRASPAPQDTVYLMAATTGLRRSELASLTWGDLDLEARTVSIRAEKSKNRKAQVLPLPKGTAERLAELRGEVTPGARVFATIPEVATLKRDLARAGIEFETPAGVVDFHALRVTFGTSLARAGVSLALAQKLMRHSTPVLTANIYMRLELHDEAAAVAKIDTFAPAKKRRKDPRRP
jgi:integrase